MRFGELGKLVVPSLAKSLRRMSSSKATTAAVSLNTDKLNYDGSLSFGALEEVVGGWAFLEKTKTKDILARLPEGCSVVVTKELEMPAETIRSLPKTVKLICEAGTGGSLLLSLSLPLFGVRGSPVLTISSPLERLQQHPLRGGEGEGDRGV